MSHKPELPVEVVEEIKRQAREYARKHGRKEIGYYAMNWKDGATAYATDRHHLQHENAELRRQNAKLKQQATGWVKGIPAERKTYFARVKSVLAEGDIYDAIIMPIENTDHWWAYGCAFRFSLHESRIVEWLEEQPAAVREEDWIDVNDRLPEEGGRYWCYVESLTDLGYSYFQWNCDYNPQLRRFSDMTLTNGERITHWRPLAKLPIFKQQKEKQ